jgi:putative ABC transport system ATP-binding protein
MAYSFSRPSAKRAARVLALRRDSGSDLPSEGAGRLSGDLHDPVTGLTVPAGALTAVVCGDPDTAGRLAERLGGHPADGNNPLSVLLGGVPLDEVPLEEARTAVLVQDKDPVLLSGTLRELLDVPRSGHVTPQQALAAAQCDDVLDALLRAGPDGDPAKAPVTERGRSLSGGQRQRLALARSLVTDPEVLVLDDPTSAVDSHTEARIAEALRQVRAGRTTVVFSSSPLLLAGAEHVAFLQDGKVTGNGTHRQLIRTDGQYRAVVTREAEAGPDLDAAAEGAERA